MSTVWSPTLETGQEGSVIFLGSISGAGTTLTISGIPVGATLSDGQSHSFTAKSGSTSVSVVGWSLTSLQITPTNDHDFVLTANGANGAATEVVTVTPLAPTLTPVVAVGVEGAAIALNLGATVNKLTGDSNSLASLVVGSIPLGATLSDGTHIFTSSAGNTSVDVSGWKLASLKITTAGDANFALSLSATSKDGDGNISAVTTATEAVTINPVAPAVTWAAPPAAGMEGSAIALGGLVATANGVAGDINVIASIVISAIPVGATLSDGTHTFTASAGNTSVDVRSWALTGLTIKPLNDANFTLSVAVTESDAEGNLSAATTKTEVVKVNPLAPTINWSPAPAAGLEGSKIALGNLVVTANGAPGDSNTLSSLVINAVPVGATLSDGTHAFVATTGHTSIDVTTWTLSSLTITPSKDTDFTLGVTATAKDADGNTTIATATEVVTVTPLAPTLTPVVAVGVEGAAIALNLGATVNKLTGDSNSLASLVVGSIPLGATLSDGTHIFTSSAGNTSVDVSGWKLASLKITAAGDANVVLSLAATSKDGDGNISAVTTATEAVTINPVAPAVTWAAPPAAGMEGSAIALGGLVATANGVAGDINVIASIVISAIPVGATLSDGTHTFTASAGNTSVDVRSWALTGLTIKPLNDANFTLSVAVTESDAEGNLSAATTKTEVVKVNPLAPTINWSPAPAAGLEGSKIALGNLVVTANGAPGDSNTLSSLVINAVPVGATLSDGTHAFVATTGHTSIDVSTWTLSSLTITPSKDIDFTLGVTATAKDADGNTTIATGVGSSIILANGTFNLSNTAFDIAKAALQITVNGSNNVLNVASSSDTIVLQGANNSVAFGANSSTLSLSANLASLTITGANDVVTVAGSNNSITFSASNTNLNLTDPSSTINITGNNDTATISASGDTITVFGSGDAVTATGDNLSVQLRGNNDSLSVSTGSGVTTILDTLGTGDTITVNASGAATTNVVGANGTITINNNDWYGPNNVTVSGAFDTVTVNSNNFYGYSDLVTVSGTSDTVVVNNLNYNPGNPVTVSGTNDFVTINNATYNDSVVVSGAGDTVNINRIWGAGVTSVDVSGTNDVVALNDGGDTVLFSAASTLALTMSNGTVDVTAGGATLNLSGTGDAVTMEGANDALALNSDNSTLTIAASNSGDTITVFGSGDTVTATGDNLSVQLRGSSNSLSVSTGSGVTTILDTLGTGDTITVNASGAATTNVVGANGTITINNNDWYGPNNVTVSGAFDTVTVNSNNFYGYSDLVTVSGTSDTVVVNNLNYNPGNPVTVSGTNDFVTINNATYNDSVLVSGAGDTVNINRIWGAGVTSVNVSGTNDVVALNDGGDTVLFSAASPLALTMSNGTVDVTAGGATLNLSGTGDAVTMEGANDALALNSDNSTLTIAASNSGDTISVFGSGDTLTATGDNLSVRLQGSNDSLSVSTGSGVTTILDTLGTGDTITVNASGAAATNVVGANGTITINNNDWYGPNNVTISGAFDTVTVNSNNFYGYSDLVTVSGTSDTVVVNNLNYNPGNPVTVSGTNDFVTINNATYNDSVVVSGSGDTVNINRIWGAGVTSVDVSGTNDVVALNDGGDTVLFSAASTLALTMSNGTVDVTAGGATLNLSGTGDAVTMEGANDSLVFSSDNATLTITASNSINAYQSSAAISLAGHDDVINVIGHNENVNITGDRDTVTVGPSAGDGGDIVRVSALNDTVTTNGDYNSTIVSGSGDVVIVNGSYGGVSVTGDHDVVTVNGGGESVAVSGTNDTLFGNALSFAFATSNTALNVTTNNGAVEITGDSVALTVSGGNNTIGISGANGNVVQSGSSGTFVFSGSGNTITASGNENFVFKPNFGQDTILGFTTAAASSDSHGVIDLSALNTNATSVQSWIDAHVSQSTQAGHTSDTVISVDATDTIVLHNVLASTLSTSDFHLA